MKINKILSICTAMALLSSGCSDDLGLQPDNAPVAGQGQTVRIAASMGDGGSRLAYSETAKELVLSWEKGDQLKVLNPSCDSLITDFALVEGDGTPVGCFEGTPVNAYAEGDLLHVLYHNAMVETNVDGDGNVFLSLKDQDGKLNPDFQLMYGSTVYEGEESQLSLKLENLVSLVKLTIPTEKTLTSIGLTGSFRSQAKLVLGNSVSDAPYINFQPGDLVYNRVSYDYDENGNYITPGITLSGNFEPVNGEVTVYFYVLPVKEYWPEWDWYNEMWIQPSFVASDAEGKSYVGSRSFGHKQMESGKMYELSTDIFEIVDFENEDVADGSESRPYEIATVEQMYSFMKRCDLNLRNQWGSWYKNCNYRLTADIALDGRISWTPANFNNGVFDGDGHVISGSVDNTLFGTVQGATIKNLVLALNMTNDSNDSFGSLALWTYHTTILNCVTRSNMKVMANHIGGLVGVMDYGSVMIGCASEAYITFVYENWLSLENAGGLVGVMYNDSFIEACYSRAYISVTGNGGPFASLGGLVGKMEGEARLNACWSSPDLTVVNSSSVASVEAIVGSGNSTCCFHVDAMPSAQEIAEMNAAMTSGMACFDENGMPVIVKTDVTGGNVSGENYGNGGVF